ncbi:hypothetical protein [Photobacterium carnosum]|jgi:hypothetical protein|uniref:hypothetical protein n=1 Tax=Photobacterium carnosum TaxID=2023717 RepID=UPI00142D6857|nr:hypothetical protein [Photobacterium carnosum]MBY3787210.1 hypothetical protein [Photobacterium carnosum]MCD9493696.1 hypothetical protein [Photobacterium carnosum]MCD9497303.1 hypothetical protein [Photobacterium carnosum]MCD9513717.1 hypothetical protein [Photobacterium carnosum]MCD9523287.1 hypothetical protein [Photobacterium carnosum]
MTKSTVKDSNLSINAKPKRKKPLTVNQRTVSIRERIENIKAQQAWDKEWENDE